MALVNILRLDSRKARLVAPAAMIGLIAVAFAALTPSLVSGQAACQDGPQSTGAVYRICMPDSWNGDLVLWAHGYVDPSEPVAIPEGQLALPDGTSLPDIVNGLDYAFATTSYRDNGLVVPLAIDDLIDLVTVFETRIDTPGKVFVFGASEGGLITTLAVEKHPDVFDGGIAACGPIGDFNRQVSNFGDFRVLFDYFFPGILPGTGPEIPQEVIDNWDTVYEPAIVAAIKSNSNAIRQLMAVSRAPFDSSNLNTVIETVRGLLWYNVHATNDGITKLGGNPFENSKKVYRGSANDYLLNWGVKRYTADPAALAEINANYQTSGRLEVPLVTLHTRGDPVVPYAHEDIYTWKTIGAGDWLMHINVPIDRYGHCQFEAPEALFSFFLLQVLVTING